MNKLENLIVVPDKGILIINGESKEMISGFRLEFISGKWVLTFAEEKRYDASAPGWG